MAGSVKLRCGVTIPTEGRLWAGSVEGQERGDRPKFMEVLPALKQDTGAIGGVRTDCGQLGILPTATRRDHGPSPRLGIRRRCRHGRGLEWPHVARDFPWPRGDGAAR